MIRKLLVANRGEIAIRAFRAANELGIASVAVFAFEDRYSLHRQKADESYEIGVRGRPVRSYLDVAEVIRVARTSGADAVYPGYGFLSEAPDLAAACADNGLAFVGPSAEVLHLAGNKVRALEAARAAGLPTLRTASPQHDRAALIAAAEEIGFPVFVKAAAGGGGRGLRRVEAAAELPGAIDLAVSEAESAFGDGAVFLEQAVVRPRHIEVQVLADAAGEVVHLFERDCSIQRRHQKVVEIAPAPGLDPVLRDRLCADAVTFARSIGYRNAGTVEFLVDAAGRHVFIEMNPRIQVEHTVTEEVTSVDLVQSQLRIAGGATLSDLGLSQDTITVTGAALQCRITTEDPAEGFRPDTGRITAYRSPGGAGVRLDGGTYPGAEILPFFDSLLVKQTCRGRTFADALARSRRALAEFRIRGVTTNIAFLQAILAEPELAAGGITTSFLEEHPELANTRAGSDRGTRMLSYLADVTVNKPHGPAPDVPVPASKLPALDTQGPVPPGSRQRLETLGAAGFARALRDATEVAVTDTTLRDAHQSLLATRLRTYDMVAVAPWLARSLPGLLSLEAWGGATYDVALRFLKEDPWDRLAQLRAAVPNICLQMLLRGRNTVGYTPYPDRVATAFVAEAAATGIDIFRVFDAFNDVEQMRPAIEAVLESGKVAEGTLCYSGDLSNPAEELYTLDYYLGLAERLVDTGCHVLCVKDMAGLLRAPAASRLIAALRDRFDLPVHLHTHDTAGGQLATYLAAIDAGVDAVDGAAGPLSGTTSQPPLAAIVAATDHTPRATGLSLDALNDLEPYWAAVRVLYGPFEAGLPAPTGRVYRHEIPGGQLSNLRTQAVALGLGDRFEVVEDLYAAADRILGRIIKVTPSSKVVGDLALYLCGVDADPAAFEANPAAYDIPDSVIGFLQGELGDPPGGWPEPFRTKALEGRGTVAGVVELDAADDAALDRPELVRATLNRLLFPGPTREFDEARRSWGDVSVVPTRAFLYGLEPGEEIEVTLGAGLSLFVSIDAVGEVDDGGFRTVYCRLNGQSRALTIRDRSAKDLRPRGEKAVPNDPNQVAAPFAGVVAVRVAAGDHVTAGQTVATIEAMKMEAAITSGVTGTVARLAVEPLAAVEGGDLILVVTP
jgi:pyruvate carboxylase